MYNIRTYMHGDPHGVPPAERWRHFSRAPPRQARAGGEAPQRIPSDVERRLLEHAHLGRRGPYIKCVSIYKAHIMSATEVRARRLLYMHARVHAPPPHTHAVHIYRVGAVLRPAVHVDEKLLDVRVHSAALTPDCLARRARSAAPADRMLGKLCLVRLLPEDIVITRLQCQRTSLESVRCLRQFLQSQGTTPPPPHARTCQCQCPTLEGEACLCVAKALTQGPMPGRCKLPSVQGRTGACRAPLRALSRSVGAS